MANTRKAAIGFIFVTLLIDTMVWGLIIPVMADLLAETGRRIRHDSGKLARCLLKLARTGL